MKLRKKNKLQLSAKKKTRRFVIFIIVSIVSLSIHFLLLNTLNYIPFIRELYKKPFKWLFIESDLSVGGLGYLIVELLSDLISRIVAFFINRKITFQSNAKITRMLPIYILFSVVIVIFSGCINPHIKELLVTGGKVGEVISSNISTVFCCIIQFFLFYTFNLFIFVDKDEKKDNTSV